LEQNRPIPTLQLVEALLFLENRPVNINYISKILNRDREEIIKCISILKEKLKQAESSLIIIENETEDYHLTISPEYYGYLEKYYDTRKKSRLSIQALETLAIIAYKQPITRAEIEKIRGVQVGYILKILLENELITFAGRKNAPGRPVLYGTTDKFLKYFGLLSLKDLPPIEEFEKK